MMDDVIVEEVGESGNQRPAAASDVKVASSGIITILEEEAVDVFVTDGALSGELLDFDDVERSLGMLFSLASIPSSGAVKLRTMQAVLDMLRLTYDERGIHNTRSLRRFHIQPNVRAIRRVTWPDANGTNGMVLVSDKSYLGAWKTVDRKAPYKKVVAQIQDACTPLAGSTAMWQGRVMDVVSQPGRYGLRILPGDAALVDSVTLLVPTQQNTQEVNVIDVQNDYLDRLKKHKQGDEVVLYEPGAPTPALHGTIVKVQPEEILVRPTSQGEDQEYQTTQEEDVVRIPTTLSPGALLIGKSIDGLSSVTLDVSDKLSAGVDLVASWGLPHPAVYYGQLNKSEPLGTIQSILDSIGWTGQLTSWEWQRLARLCSTAVRLSDTIPHDPIEVPGAPSAITPLVEAGIYKHLHLAFYQRHVADRKLIDAWWTAKQPDSGLLAILDALHRLGAQDAISYKKLQKGGAAAAADKKKSPPRKKKKPSSSHLAGEVEDEDGVCSNGSASRPAACTFVQTPSVIIQRFVSDAAEDQAISTCDLASFTDYGGLAGVTLSLSSEDALLEKLGGRYLGWHEMHVPSPECMLQLHRLHASKHMLLTVSKEHQYADIPAYVARVVTFLKASSQSKLSLPHWRWDDVLAATSKAPRLDVVNGDGDDLQLGMLDGAHYNILMPPRFSSAAQEAETPKTLDSSGWDYGAYLTLLAASLQLQIPPRMAEFIVGNVAFANPSEIYLGRLRRAIQIIKERHKLSRADGRKNKVQEQRMINKVRRDTLSIFCTRTLACCAALVYLGMQQNALPQVAYPCSAPHQEGLDMMACAIHDILQGGLSFSSELSHIRKLLHEYVDRFTVAKKVLPVDIVQSAINHTIKTVKSQPGPWSGYRPAPQRLGAGAVIAAIETVAQQAALINKSSSMPPPIINRPGQRQQQGQRRCCLAEGFNVQMYFMMHESVASAADQELADAQDFSLQWKAQVAPAMLHVDVAGTREGRDTLKESRHDRILKDLKTTVGVGHAVSMNVEVLTEWIRENQLNNMTSVSEDPAWPNAALVSSKTQLTKLFAAAGLDNKKRREEELILIPRHAGFKDRITRHRILFRYMHSALPAIVQRSQLHAGGLVGHVTLVNLETLNIDRADQKWHGVLYSILVGALVEKLSLLSGQHHTLREALEDLIRRLQTGIIDRDALQQALQQQREADKMRKLHASRELTDEQRELLQEFRKFRRVGWEDVEALLQQPSSTPQPLTDGENGNIENGDNVQFISQGGLGALDRDEDASRDDIDYDNERS